MAGAEFGSIPEIVRAARLRMPPAMWDHASGGSESEATLRRNRLAMETLAFRPRILRGVAEPDLSTTFLGQRLESPVMLAPVGSIARFHPDGALGPARVASRRGTAYCVGVLSWPSLTEVAETAGGKLLLQIYVRGDRDWLRKVVGRAEAAGYVGICLTADSIGTARRDRDALNRYEHHAGADRPNLKPGAGEGRDYQLSFSWDDFDWLRSITRLPVVLKGVLTADDALLAVEHGADAIYVSNHGGRELDHVPATMELLPSVLASAAGRAEVIVDSGFLRGTDVVKAVALGARAVLLGKLQVWGLAAGGGEASLERTLEILDEEIRETLMLLGVKGVRELSLEYLQAATPTRASLMGWEG